MSVMFEEELQGAYSLNSESVNKAVSETSPGAYVLGEFKADHFQPRYVGRSDRNVRGRLIDHVSDTDYSFFCFQYCGTVREAFEAECIFFHSFESDLDNKRHPDRPNGKDWSCPCCDHFGFDDGWNSAG